MAVRKPLVIKDGQIQQLQAGDMLVGQNLSVDLTNASGSATIPKLNPVQIFANNQCSTAINITEDQHKVIGFAIEAIPPSTEGTVQILGVIEGTTAEWDAVTGDTGGLSPGPYWLDDGVLTPVSSLPETVDTRYVKRIGTAISATKFKIDPDISVLL